MKHPEWKQPSSLYQSRSIIMAIMGNLELLDPGMMEMPEAKKWEVIQRALSHVEALRDLCDGYLPEKW
jgi:hypothetical protein